MVESAKHVSRLPEGSSASSTSEVMSAPVCELAESHPYLLPCVRLSVDGTEVGVMGRVRPEMADSFHARKDVWLAELNLDVLRRLHDAAQVRFQSLAVFPPVRRDITVAAPVGVTVGAILDQIISPMELLVEEDRVSSASCLWGNLFVA